MKWTQTITSYQIQIFIDYWHTVTQIDNMNHFSLVNKKLVVNLLKKYITRLVQMCRCSCFPHKQDTQERREGKHLTHTDGWKWKYVIRGRGRHRGRNMLSIKTSQPRHVGERERFSLMKCYDWQEYLDGQWDVERDLLMIFFFSFLNSSYSLNRLIADTWKVCIVLHFQYRLHRVYYQHSTDGEEPVNTGQWLHSTCRSDDAVTQIKGHCGGWACCIQSVFKAVSINYTSCTVHL